MTPVVSGTASALFLAVAVALFLAQRGTAATPITHCEKRTGVFDGGVDRIVSLIALTTTTCAFAVVHLRIGLSTIGAVMSAMIAVKLFLADRYRRRPLFAAVPLPLRVCAVMPLHNEDPAYAVAGVASMLRQSRPIERIHVIDDGSGDGGAAASAVRRHLIENAGEREWEVTILPTNRGKRQALAQGFLGDPGADIYLCVDSDTVLDAHAVEEGLRPFSDPAVTGVAGLVSAHNRRRNLLTRLIDLRYVSAFLSERAAYSAFGAVLCCCGSLSFYRGEVVRANLDDFLNQRFLGKNATFGDDRRLTNYALRAGKVVLAERSQASTAVPERLGHYVRQQIRWNKSFFRESIWVLGTFPLRSPAFWLTMAELGTWIVIGSILLATAVLFPLLGQIRHVPALLVFVMLAAWARNTAYLEHRRHSVARRDRLFVFVLAPLYGLLHLIVLMPVRLFALATIKQTKWGTRTKVEVVL